MNRVTLLFAVLMIVSIVLHPSRLAAQEKERSAAAQSSNDGAQSVEQDAAADADAADKDREQRLADYLSGAKFVGRFTVDGKPDASPKTEEYTISKCEKLPQKDLYRMTARIKYGDVDNEVPLDLKILWSGSTPVITLDSFWIPGMGTFGARVLIHSGRYAGTWQHDAVGGHMYGMIEK